MQTKNCDSHGPPDHPHDKGCTAKLTGQGESGYCQCAKNVKVGEKLMA